MRITRFPASILLILFLVACNQNNRSGNHNNNGSTDHTLHQFLNQQNITSQFFNINADIDNFLQTSHGSKLRIAKGAFPAGSSVRIEIKEVFTPAEIMASGLTTLSDGKPLRSAGMLYFGATAAGKEIQPALPITTTIPTSEPDPDMMVFKGEYGKDSVVNWVDPITPDSMPTAGMIANGRALFRSNCNNCHRKFVDGTGPALKDVQLKRPWRNKRNLVAFVNNPAAFMAKDQYTQKLKAQFGSMMTPFPNLNAKDLDNIIAYLSSIKEDEPFLPRVTTKADHTGSVHDAKSDCGFDTSYIPVIDTFPEYDTTVPHDVIVPLPTTFTTQVVDYTTTGLYSFKITGTGWYNVDAYLKTGQTDVVDVDPSIRVHNPDDMDLAVVLFMPAERIMLSLDPGDDQQWVLPEGQQSLPRKARAVVLALGTYKEQAYYAVKEITVEKGVKISLDLEGTQPDKLKYIINAHRLDDVDIEAMLNERKIVPKPCP